MSFMPSSLTLAGFQPEDDIDTLFQQLSTIEPPGELLARILTHVWHLPGPLANQDRLKIPEGVGIEALIVRNEKRDPS